MNNHALQVFEHISTLLVAILNRGRSSIPFGPLTHYVYIQFVLSSDDHLLAGTIPASQHQHLFEADHNCMGLDSIDTDVHAD